MLAEKGQWFKRFGSGDVVSLSLFLVISFLTTPSSVGVEDDEGDDEQDSTFCVAAIQDSTFALSSLVLSQCAGEEEEPIYDRIAMPTSNVLRLVLLEVLVLPEEFILDGVMEEH